MLGFRVGVRVSLQNTCNKVEAHIRDLCFTNDLGCSFPRVLPSACFRAARPEQDCAPKPWTRRIFALASNARRICMSVILECLMQALTHKHVVCCLIASQ